MKYTIVNSETGAPFIQGAFDTIEEAERRLAELQVKASSYSLAVVVLEDDAEGREEKTEKPPPSQNRPRPSSRGPRS